MEEARSQRECRSALVSLPSPPHSVSLGEHPVSALDEAGAYTKIAVTPARDRCEPTVNLKASTRTVVNSHGEFSQWKMSSRSKKLLPIVCMAVVSCSRWLDCWLSSPRYNSTSYAFSSLYECCFFLPSSYCHLHKVAKVTPVPRCALLKSPASPLCTAAGKCDYSFCGPSRLQHVQIVPAGPQQQLNLSMESLSLWTLRLLPDLIPSYPEYLKKSPRICRSPHSSHLVWWDLTPSFASINHKGSLHFSAIAPDICCCNRLQCSMACQKTQFGINGYLLHLNKQFIIQI